MKELNMNIFNTFIAYLQQFDENEKLKYIGVIIGIIVLGSGIFLYRFSYTTNLLIKRLQRTNKLRIEAEPILLRYAQVMQQKKRVDTMLNNNPNFRTIELLTTTLRELSLSSFLTKEPEITNQNVVDGYIEQKVFCRLNGVTMQQIVNLLAKIEQNERVYTKDITITRSTSSPSVLDLVIEVATIEAKESIA